MKKLSILVLSDPDEPQLSMLDELRETANVVIGNSAAAFEKAAGDAGIILNWSGSRSPIREVFLMSHGVRWVHSRSAGLERTLFPELIASNVTMTNGSGVFSPSLGEFALAAILYFAKDFRRMIRNQMAGVWEPFDVLPVSGKTVGIVGYGDIGRAVAARVRPLGMNVLAIKRHVSTQNNADPFVDQIYSPDHRVEMLSHCDYVVVAAPLNAETRGLIGAEEFAAMKPSAVIINVGRGPVIEERAMIKALSVHTIKGAALDVFAEEPLPNGHPFYKMENVLLCPHCADHTPDWLDNAMRFFIAQFDRFRRGEPLLNVVDKKLGY
ncbi:MAG TPA: D-2-hydroxyacid dehydrogenase [Candidatus Acidoferrum sp.]|nr:D-2-hydroxyacid dehydrogenase [Candidatus Acidoferrum sp.]